MASYTSIPLRDNRRCVGDSCVSLFLVRRVRCPDRGSKASGRRGCRHVDKSRKDLRGRSDLRDSSWGHDLSVDDGVTPFIAASGAIGVLIAASWISWLIGQAIGSRDMQSNVMNIKRICEACLFGVRSGVLTAILMVSIGVINNAIVTSGIGNGFSLMIAQWSQGSLGIAILLIGLASLVLGMGLPVTAAYIIMAILCAPALAGILADTMIVEQLMVGLTDPSQSALFMLVDSPLRGEGGDGYDRARGLEFGRCDTLRGRDDPEAGVGGCRVVDRILADSPPDNFLVESGQ